MKKTYTGGCQCEKVRFEAQADIGEVITCNCSRCRRVGPLLSAVAVSDFKLLSGENEMTGLSFIRTFHPVTYRFNTLHKSLIYLVTALSSALAPLAGGTCGLVGHLVRSEPSH